MDPKEADRIHRLVEQSPDGLFIIVGGRFEFLNEAGLAMFGRDSLPVRETLQICTAVHGSRAWEFGRHVGAGRWARHSHPQLWCGSL